MLPLAIESDHRMKSWPTILPHLSDNSDWDKGFYMAIAWPKQEFFSEAVIRLLGQKKLSLFTGTANQETLNINVFCQWSSLYEITEDKTNI